MSSKQTSYLSLGGLIRLGLIFTVLYTAYAFDGVSTAVGSGWAVKMKLQGKARECPWPQVLQFYPHLEEFNTRYASYLHQVKVLELDPNFPIERVQTREGEMWTRTTPKGTEFSYISAEHDWLEAMVADKHVRPGDVVIDVGGHVGLFTRKALARGAAQVITIEPDPNSVECLKRNFADEIAAGRVTIVQAGAWHEEGVMELSLGDSPGWNSLAVRRSDRSIEVPVRKLDDIIAELKLDKVSFIKMDIEGAEPNALRGSRHILSKYHPTVMIDAYTWPEDLSPLDEILRDADASYDRSCGPCEATAEFDLVMPHVVFYNTPAGRV